MSDAREYNRLFLEQKFSNEIDDLPEPNVYDYKRKYQHWETPEEIQVEIERDREVKESAFRKWLIKNKPTNAIMTPIETSTATGVPDIYCCYNGMQTWIECKVIASGPGRFRGTQYIYLKNLIQSGGYAKVAIQLLSKRDYKPASIHIYNAEDLVTVPPDLFKKSGQDLLFPPQIKPWYIWYYNQKKSITIEDLYQHLLIDKCDLLW